MAPTYVDTRMSTASPAAGLNVRVVSSASPRVGVRPGSIPTAIPSRVAQATLKSVPGGKRSTSAAAKNPSPSMVKFLRERHEEDALEDEGDDRRHEHGFDE